MCLKFLLSMRMGRVLMHLVFLNFKNFGNLLDTRVAKNVIHDFNLDILVV